MNNRKQRLELTWIGKDERPRLEPRILIEDSDQSYHAAVRHSDEDIFDNILIHGDNFLALKGLESDFSGQVKCVYIDPPFNTQQAMENYEDGLEHSIWLSLMRDRIEAIHRLLHEEGTLFIHIDDNELGYLIALADEVFGRSNRCYVITFRQASATGHKSINPGCVSTTNFILIYAKNKERWTPNRVYTSRERDKRYNQFILNPEDDFESWNIVPLTRGISHSLKISEKDVRALAKSDPESIDRFVLENPQQVIRLAVPDYNAVSKDARSIIDLSKKQKDRIFRLERDDYSDFYFFGGQRILFYTDKLKLIDGVYVAGEPLTTLWDDVLSNNLHNEGGVRFPKGKKPEALIKRCLELATRKGDLVLDSFAGSGTTGAVAHKMARRWIMVELGDSCQTHIVPRLTRVIDGTDTSGITQSQNWKGGGGFRHYRLAPSLLEKDGWGNWVISRSYSPAMLTEAVCKLMGFTYEPSETHYWMHGRSSETDFIYVTTQSLTHEQLRAISEEVGDERSLLICCKAFRANIDTLTNLTVRKIPQAVLRKCEWGKDDYSLNVAALPMAEPDEVAGQEKESSGKRYRRRVAPGQDDLFEREAGE